MSKSAARLSIKQISLMLGVGLLIMVSVLASLAAWQTRSALQNLDRTTREAAQSELLAATETLLRRVAIQAEELARWDETRQMLIFPEYYAYWRNQRVYESGLLSGRHVHASLFDAEGRALDAPEAGWVVDQSARHRAQSWLTRENGTLYLYQVHPVYGDDENSQLLGQIALRVDFMASLLRNTDFHFVAPQTIALPLQAADRVRPDGALKNFVFETVEHPEQTRFGAIMSRTLMAFYALLALAALVSYVVYGRILIRPLAQLSRDIEAMQQGRYAPTKRPAGMNVSELASIRHSLHEYQAQLRELHGSLENQNREFRSQARQDALTGCYNRRAYEEDWARFCEDNLKAPQDVAFLLFDCDRFKTINDTYGHAKGDRVLTLITDALVMALRANDRLYRLGGDEFGAFLLHATAAQARQIAQRCQTLIEAIAFSDIGITEPVGVSIGIAFCGASDAERATDLPKQADIAMYTAKQPGRSRIALYGEDIERASQTLVASRETSALFQALVTPGLFEMHYQPIHALPSRKVDYYEALARIRYRGELIMPGAFLPVVSSRRLETEFDLAILQQVDSDLSSGRLPDTVGVSINLSAQSISHAEVVSQLLELSRHNARHPLMLEITETSLITQISEVSTYLDLLRTVHFQIAMDDFGTGYSPLRYLADLPVDIVKLDISLTSKLAQDNRASQLVADFVRMMHDAGYKLVAEGVETEAELAKIETLGIAHVQGYLLGRPQPLDQLCAHASEDATA